jgi:hypothetical protein
VLRLTLLSPANVAAILDGRAPQEQTMARLFRPFPAEWEVLRDLLPDYVFAHLREFVQIE